MTVYLVEYTYFCQGRRAVKGDVKIIAESVDKAQEAFEAVHPDGEVFSYEVTGIHVDSL